MEDSAKVLTLEAVVLQEADPGGGQHNLASGVQHGPCTTELNQGQDEGNDIVGHLHNVNQTKENETVPQIKDIFIVSAEENYNCRYETHAVSLTVKGKINISEDEEHGQLADSGGSELPSLQFLTHNNGDDITSYTTEETKTDEDLVSTLFSTSTIHMNTPDLREAPRHKLSVSSKTSEFKIMCPKFELKSEDDTCPVVSPLPEVKPMQGERPEHCSEERNRTCETLSKLAENALMFSCPSDTSMPTENIVLPNRSTSLPDVSSSQKVPKAEGIHVNEKEQCLKVSPILKDFPAAGDAFISPSVDIRGENATFQSFMDCEISPGQLSPASGEDREQVKVAWEVDLSEFKPKTKQKKETKSKTTKPAASSPQSVKPGVGKRVESDQCTPSPPAADICQRKVFDLKRWYCISRPQYKTSCGISSVISCWNYLFSTLGGGSCAPITQEEALVVLGFSQPFEDIRFGPFTGNATLMRWFSLLNAHYNVRGQCHYLYKPKGRNKTCGVTSGGALDTIKQILRGNDTALIYHCYNHYFCPMGFEDTPLKASAAYSGTLPQEDCETWILIGEPSRKQPSIHSKRWEDISEDLNNENPTYTDIRRQWKGQLKLKTKKKGGNLHCIMAFQRSKFQGLAKTIKSAKCSRHAGRKNTPQPTLNIIDSINKSIGEADSSVDSQLAGQN